MLNRSVCRKCRVSHYKQAKYPEEIMNRRIHDFHTTWEKEHLCYCTLTNTKISVFCKPVNKCPYILEQIVADHDINRKSLP